ncbi:MAG: zinc-binding alcohol dehydrogenase family protein [Acidimicrobiales bacterium]
MFSWWMVPGPDGAELASFDVATPQPGPGEVLVTVRAAGVNRGELLAKPLLRADRGAARQPSGVEFAGEVAALGAGVTAWAVGDRVMGRGSGCHAEAVVAAARALMAVPDGWSWAQAGATPNVFVTAHDALFSAGRLAAGEAVLVTAGASGVGVAALQLAAWADAGTVLATTRQPHKAPALRALGATDVIVTTSDDWVRRVRDACGGVQLVVDQVGGSLFPGLLRCLALQGRYVSVGRNDATTSTIDLDLLARQRLELIGVTFRTRTAEEALRCSERFADDCLRALRDGALRAVVDRTFPLRELPAAHAYLASDARVGKVVLLAP